MSNLKLFLAKNHFFLQVFFCFHVRYLSDRAVFWHTLVWTYYWMCRKDLASKLVFSIFSTFFVQILSYFERKTTFFLFFFVFKSDTCSMKLFFGNYVDNDMLFGLSKGFGIETCFFFSFYSTFFEILAICDYFLSPSKSFKKKTEKWKFCKDNGPGAKSKGTFKTKKGVELTIFCTCLS